MLQKTVIFTQNLTDCLKLEQMYLLVINLFRDKIDNQHTS